jgi:hypothetical protein
MKKPTYFGSCHIKLNFLVILFYTILPYQNYMNGSCEFYFHVERLCVSASHLMTSILEPIDIHVSHKYKVGIHLSWTKLFF